MTSITVGVLGLLGGILVAWIIYQLCIKNMISPPMMNEEWLEDIANRARSIRQSSEDIETRVARLQELKRSRERPSNHEDNHKERGEGD